MDSVSTVKVWTREAAVGEKRNVWSSMKRGFRCRCPRCGEGKLFRAFLKTNDKCSVCDLDFTPAREPLIAPPSGAEWRLEWSSESPEYGGQGTRPLKFDRSAVVPGACALFFVAEHGHGTDSQD